MFLTKTKVVPIGFDAPPKLVENGTSDDEALEHYLRVREEMREMVRDNLHQMQSLH